MKVKNEITRLLIDASSAESGMTVDEIASKLNISRSAVYQTIRSERQGNIKIVDGSWPRQYYMLSLSDATEIQAVQKKSNHKSPRTVEPTVSKPTVSLLESTIVNHVKLMLENAKGENNEKLENLLIGEANKHLSGTDKVLLNSLSKPEDERNYSQISFLACAVMCYAIDKAGETK